MGNIGKSWCESRCARRQEAVDLVAVKTPGPAITANRVGKLIAARQGLGRISLLPQPEQSMRH